MPERLRFERELSDLGLREYDQEQPSPKADQAVIGEQIALDIRQDSRLPQRGIKSVRWEIPGQTVKSYEATTKGMKMETLSASDLTGSRVTFHWVDAGRGREVKVHYTIDIGWGASMPLQHVFKIFDVEAPRLDHFRAAVSKPVLVKKDRKWKLSLGDKSKGGGIIWDWQVTMPKNHAGMLKDLQTVKMGRKKVQKTSPNDQRTRTLKMVHPDGAEDYQLDQEERPRDELPQEAIFSSPALFRETVKAGQTFSNNNSFDVPSTELKPLDVSFSVDESFRYYILFKPDKTNAVWVPIARAEWFWKAEAVRKGSAWAFAKNTRPDSGVKGGKGAPSTEFPRYRSIAGENRWCEIGADGSILCGNEAP